MEAMYQTSWWHKGQIGALTTVEAVISYDHTVGWPTGWPMA
jgi:hypothetical protein